MGFSTKVAGARIDRAFGLSLAVKVIAVLFHGLSAVT